MCRIVFGLGVLLVVPMAFWSCLGDDPQLESVGDEDVEGPAELGKADGDQFFHGYFVSESGEIVTDDATIELAGGTPATLKFSAPRNYGFEGGITAYIVDSYGYIPYGTAYDVDCGTPGDYYIVREDTASDVRADEPVCQVSTARLYPGEYAIHWQFYEYTYEGDWDWYSTRVLETGGSGRFVVTRD
jgi:hypothetical protein